MNITNRERDLILHQQEVISRPRDGGVVISVVEQPLYE